MPLPIILGAVLIWGAEVAVGLAVGYACEKAVENTVGDTPLKYACYLIPTGGVVKGIGKAVAARGAIKLAIKRPATVVEAFKIIGGKSVKFLKNLPSNSISGAWKFVGGLTRKVLANSLVKLGVFVGLVTATVSAVNYVVNFNFNVSDEELTSKITQEVTQFYSLFGGAVGSAAGFLMCGALPGVLLFNFNPAVALVAMEQLEESAKAQIYSQIATISRLTFQTLLNAEISRQFMNARRYLKRDPKHPISKLIKQVMGVQNFLKWGDSNQPSFTIQQNIIEKQIEQLPDGAKQFTQTFLQNFSESCIESGFVIANNIDSAIAANVLAQRAIIGNPTEVSIVIDPPPTKALKKA